MNVARALAIEGWTTPAELAWLAERAGACQTIIEVGSFLGRSARALADACAGTVYCIDLWRGFDGLPDPPDDAYYHAFSHNLSDVIADGRVRPIRSDSLAWDDPTLRGVDMVFLDGHHDEAHVAAEIRKYARLVRPGGVLCGHDYRNREHPGVQRAVDACLRSARRGPGSIWWVTP